MRCTERRDCIIVIFITLSGTSAYAYIIPIDFDSLVQIIRICSLNLSLQEEITSKSSGEFIKRRAVSLIKKTIVS